MGDHVAVEKLDGLEVLNEDSVSFNGFLNPNRRRDDPEEKAADALRAEINASNRFDSFGRRTFRKRVYIHPRLVGPLSFICAPPAKHSEWSLDKVLKRKAQQGVKVYVVVYKEVSQTMSMSSKHAKHIGAEDTVKFWSHHEKVAVVDNHYACIGGLDLYFRRCDTHNHPLADVHLSSHALVRDSQDYNNARIIGPSARMPWHDVHMSPSGPVVLDISIARYPHREVWHVMGRKCEQRWHDWLGAVRSVSDWSHGMLTEHSIQNALRISATKKGDVVTNEIAGALAHTVIRAAREGRNFEIVVVIPEVPAFSGNIKDESSLKIIMAAQYRTITINWDGASIYETIRKAGFELMDYIRFCHLRAYNRINAPQHSGVSLHQAQVALVRQWLGSQVTSATDSGPIKVTIKVTIKSPQVTKEGVVITEKMPLKEEAVAVSDTEEEEAKQIIRRFERAAEAVRGDEDVSNNVVQHMLSDKTGLEQYKLMIVDDRRVIMGSANLNDRSQKRDSDSEIAFVVEDTDLVQSTMDGEPYMASRFAASLKRQMCKSKTTTCMMTTPIPYMRSAPHPNPDRLNSQEDQMVAAPLSTNPINLWTGIARQNREILTEVFRPVPSNLVRIGHGMIDMYPKTKTGHVPGIPLQRVKDRLSKVKGALVEAPIDFLIDDKGFVEGPDWAG
ncbi:phospholipase D/nuclease [Lentinula aff. lateritia]|uniref:Phospholipase D/nuclease n=1 Tax=Lentinula aff. lateritia TaxID=2804960 RepID=A0ACC1TRZ8_9AGAR|nr:phospholipase D/nuclease [Lentinula aff. lateritia]